MAEGRATEAVECLRKARKLAPQEESLLLPRLMKILDADPSSAEAHLLLADVLIKNGERDRAIVILRHLVRETPASAGEALARFASILKEAPQAPRARVGAAEACLELKRFPESLGHLKEVAGAHRWIAHLELKELARRIEGQKPRKAPFLRAGVGRERGYFSRERLDTLGERAGGSPAVAARHC